MSTLSKFFESAKLPVMSEVAQELIRTLNDDDASAGQVEKILSKDPALTANVLRLANSAQFGLSRQVQSLDHAIQLLGMARVRSLALSDSMSAAFPHVPGLDRMEFWNASMACAAYAHWLAALADEDTQQAWLGGMMLRLPSVRLRRWPRLRTIQTTPECAGNVRKICWALTKPR
jgi:HD-like signal output (HDOD) protein